MGERLTTGDVSLDIFVLKPVSNQDGEDVFNMLQHIDAEENAFKNPVKGMSFSEFKQWVKQQQDWASGRNLPEGYVAQTIYWLLVNDIPVGIGKIRHKLTTESRKKGGNIGYAISSEYRGKGYGSILLKLLLKEADSLGLDEKILTVEKFNYASKRVIEKNAGRLFDENDERWFFSF